MRKYARSRFDRHGEGPAPPPGGAFPFLQSGELMHARRYLSRYSRTSARNVFDTTRQPSFSFSSVR